MVNREALVIRKKEGPSTFYKGFFRAFGYQSNTTVLKNDARGMEI
jgi:hypothetical protein